MYSNNVKKKGMKPRKPRQSRAAAAEARPGWRPEIEVLLLVGVVLAMLILVSPAMAQDGEAKIRMAHLSPDAPAVMVELDGEPVEALASVSYRDATPYLDIPAGQHDVAVFAAADPSEPVLEVSIAPEAGQSYTVAGVGLLADETFGARLFEDDTTEPDEGEARVRVIHAVPDVGPATVGVADGPDLFSLPGFANASDYVGVDAGTYTLEVTPAGAPEPAFDVPDVSVKEGEIYTAFAIGQASDGTLDTMMTVDSDNGRVIGPETLEDTSGDLSLLEEDPQPDGASSSNELPAGQITPAESSNPTSAKEIEKPEKDSQPKNSQSEAPQSEAPQSEAPQSEAPRSGDSRFEVASVETHQAPAPASEPVYEPSYAPLAAPLAAPPAPVAAEAVAEIAVPTVEEIAPEPLAADASFVPQPVQTTPVAPQVAVEVPQIPVPTVEIPPIPQVPAVSGSWSGQTTVSTQSVSGSANAVANAATTVAAANGVATAGFVPPIPAPENVAAAAQSVSQQAVDSVGGGAAPVDPVDPVVGFISNTPAVVNSGARRRFVTIRGSKGRSLPDSE